MALWESPDSNRPGAALVHSGCDSSLTSPRSWIVKGSLWLIKKALSSLLLLNRKRRRVTQRQHHDAFPVRERELVWSARKRHARAAARQSSICSRCDGNLKNSYLSRAVPARRRWPALCQVLWPSLHAW